MKRVKVKPEADMSRHEYRKSSFFVHQHRMSTLMTLQDLKPRKIEASNGQTLLPVVKGLMSKGKKFQGLKAVKDVTHYSKKNAQHLMVYIEGDSPQLQQDVVEYLIRKFRSGVFYRSVQQDTHYAPLAETLPHKFLKSNVNELFYYVIPIEEVVLEFRPFDKSLEL